ncbi:MAG: RDD family protein, partial [Treponema sp.]|nr:RDD family protein [Treponema sp.]
LFLILFFCVDWFYHVICELSFRGQSIGKRIMGIRVVRSDGAPVDPASSFLRNLLRFADTFFFLYHIAFLSMLTGSGFRRLGDRAGGTLVVYTAKSLAIPRRLKTTLLSQAEMAAPPRTLNAEEKQAILMFARRYPLLGKERANEIAGAYTDCLYADNADAADGAAAGSSAGAERLLGIARKISGGGSDSGGSVTATGAP